MTKKQYNYHWHTVFSVRRFFIFTPFFCSLYATQSTQSVGIFNVTFEPKCRNNWHIHHSENGGGQILICVAGRGYYQEWGKKAIEMLPAML